MSLREIFSDIEAVDVLSVRLPSLEGCKTHGFCWEIFAIFDQQIAVPRNE